MTVLSLFSTIAALFTASPGEISAILLLFGVAVVVILIIDDDDLPGPRLCRVTSA